MPQEIRYNRTNSAKIKNKFDPDQTCTVASVLKECKTDDNETNPNFGGQSLPISHRTLYFSGVKGINNAIMISPNKIKSFSFVGRKNSFMLMNGAGRI